MMKKYYVIFIMLIVAQFTFAQKVSVPQPTSPENEYETAFPNAVLDWLAVSGIGDITYHVQLATDESFNDLIVDDDAVAVSAYFNHNLDFGQQYFWRVKASDANNTSEWSTVFSFTTFSEIQLKDPDDGDDDVDIRPKVQWKDKVDGNLIEGFDGFDVEFDTSANFDSPLAQLLKSGKDDNGVILDEFVIDYLLFGTVYYLHVRPMHADDHGEWTETVAFETVFTVDLKKPNNGADEIEFDQMLTWKDLENNDGIYEYSCQVSTDEAFTDPVTLVIERETEVLPEFYKFGTEYFWRVKGSHVNDESDYSDVRSFETINVLELESPEDGEHLNTYRPVLKWGSINAIDGYQIRISKNADMSDAVYHNVLNAGSDSYPLNELDKSEYYWSVRAYKGNDTCEWAENYNFSTMNVGIEDIANVSNFTISPNPAVSTVKVAFTSANNTETVITITDVLGKTVISQNIGTVMGDYSKSFDISKLESGLYVVEVKQGNSTLNQKFLVK